MLSYKHLDKTSEQLCKRLQADCELREPWTISSRSSHSHYNCACSSLPTLNNSITCFDNVSIRFPSSADRMYMNLDFKANS